MTQLHFLEPLVRSAVNKGSGERFVAVHWEDPPDERVELEIDGVAWQAVPVRSTFQARRQFVEAGDEGRRVLLTPLTETELGPEVVARLAQRRVHRAEAWQLVRDAFGAQTIDPRVTGVRDGQGTSWMAATLLQHRPAGGFPPVASGTLDLETVWGALLYAAGLPNGDATPGAVLDACVRGTLVERWSGLQEAFRTGIRERWVERLGPFGEVIGRVLDAGHGDRAVALGLIAATVPRGGDADPAVHDVRVRLKDGYGVDASAMPYAEASEAWCLRKLKESGGADLEPILDEAEKLGSILGGASLLRHSPFLRVAVRLRLAAFAEAVEGALADPRDRSGRDRAGAALGELREHHLVRADERYAGLREQSEGALRLLRWLSTEEVSHASLGEQAAAYRDEDAWVDRARHGISLGIAQDEARGAFVRLAAAARERRERTNEAFARRLVAVTEEREGDGEVRYLEDVFRDVVAPLAERPPGALVIVMDGMSQAVFQQLVESIQAETSFLRITPTSEPSWRPVVAPLPTVTEVCRASLLCGELAVGPDSLERKGLDALADEYGWAKKAKAIPAVFHKGALHESGGGLSDGVLRALESGRRVVTVVVNVVDDLLPKGDQLSPRWSLAKAPALRALLEHAEVVARSVVLTADHGHVVETWDGEADLQRDAEGGERWRGAERPAGELEVEVRGRRVLQPRAGGPVVLPWSERLRYSGRHAGYHGGASPQEVVVPLAVLVPRNVNMEKALADWRPEVVACPWWWTQDDPRALPAPRRDVSRTEPVVRKEREAPAQQQFFEEPASAQAPTERSSWIDELLASEGYKIQKAAAARQRPDDDQVAQVLELLAAGGMTATLPSVQQRLRLVPRRFNGLLSLLPKLLNMDGYAVIEVNREEGSLRLEPALLAQQFGLTQEIGS